MHLFAGVGGGLLADLILGHRPIVAVEWDKYACQVLRERAADGWFPDLSVWEGDVRLFDPSEYAGRVDCIHAGFPCQDISVAGKQAGLQEGTRSGLYREVLRIAGVVRPRYLFLENVSAILSNGLGTVLGDLAAMGYDSRYLCIRASDVGAPHHRDRWFALCHAKHARQPTPEVAGSIASGSNGNKAGAQQAVEPTRPSDAKVLADCWGSRVHERRGFDGAREDVRFVGGNERHGVSGGKEKESAILAYAHSSQREERRLSGRTHQEHAVNIVNDWWEAESNVGRVANGVPHRVHQLKGLGNAQVPLQAATAWRLLGGC
ncbi:MAG: DNA cytosine methyltransferase [Pseudomonadota bacterium]